MCLNTLQSVGPSGTIPCFFSLLIIHNVKTRGTSYPNIVFNLSHEEYDESPARVVQNFKKAGPDDRLDHT
jgi:hypothetical protein